MPIQCEAYNIIRTSNDYPAREYIWGETPHLEVP